MSRPLEINCMRLSRELHVDEDVIMDWPYDKFIKWLAFYHLESDDFKKKQAIQKTIDNPMSYEDIKKGLGI